MNHLAIIPARGGSKRIPRKNIKNFLGKPIIGYSIEVALRSELFSEVMVSTDDEEIAAISKSYGATIPFLRSSQNSSDLASTKDVIIEVLHEYKKRGKDFKYSCCLYPTAPFITIDDLKLGLNKLIKNRLDSVFPVVAFSYPIWRGLKRENERISMIWPEFLNSRSQDLDTVYHDAGQWYWLHNLKIKDSLWTDNTDVIILDEIRVQDIDTILDWQLAEVKYKLLQNV